MVDISKSDGQILSNLLATFGESVTGLAARLNIHRGTVHGWKNDINKNGISYENWIGIGRALNIDIYDHVPKLKSFKKSEAQLTDSDAIGMVKDLEGKYDSTQKDVQFLKDRIGDYEDIIEAKNEVIKVQKEQILALKKELAKYEK